MPLKNDWLREIIKKGDSNVPDIMLDASAFIKVRSKNDGKERSNARSIAIFPSPSLKKGRIFGKIISA